MPTLPTLDVSQAHFDRIVAAFPGATLAEKAAAYQAWLTNSLIAEVERLEHQRIQATATAQVIAAMQAVTDSLPPRKNYPPSKALAGGTLAAPAK